jgi:hypothetical protein
VYIQWCLKGIAESPGFADSDAIALLTSGIKSNWLRQNAALSLDAGLPQGQLALNETALFRHVNDYAGVGAQTPYISLSAGIVQPSAFGYSEFPAWFTAVDFATSGPTAARIRVSCLDRGLTETVSKANERLGRNT